MAQQRKTPKCAMCGRIRELDFHHFIPRMCHSNKWFKKRFTKEEMKTSGMDVCPDCHRFLHDQHRAKELGREYTSLEQIRSDPQIARFIEWVRKKKR